MTLRLFRFAVGTVAAVLFGGLGGAMLFADPWDPPRSVKLWALRGFVALCFGAMAGAGLWNAWRAVVPDRVGVPELARRRWRDHERPGRRWVLAEGAPRPRALFLAAMMGGTACAGAMLVASGVESDSSWLWPAAQVAFGGLMGAVGSVASAVYLALACEDPKTALHVWHGLGPEDEVEVVVRRVGDALHLRGTDLEAPTPKAVEAALAEVPPELRVALEALARRGVLVVRSALRVRWTWEPPASEVRQAQLEVWIAPGPHPRTSTDGQLPEVWLDCPPLVEVVAMWEDEGFRESIGDELR